MTEKVMVIFGNLYSFCEHGSLVCMIALMNSWWMNMGAEVMVYIRWYTNFKALGRRE